MSEWWASIRQTIHHLGRSMYKTNRSNICGQQKSIQSFARETDSYRIFNLLTDNILLNRIKILLPAHRERLFLPTETLSMFVTQALSTDRSCQNAINQATMQPLIGGLPSCSTLTGGYCRARQRLLLEMVVELTRYVSQVIEA